jgi:hypothetical protein
MSNVDIAILVNNHDNPKLNADSAYCNSVVAIVGIFII